MGLDILSIGAALPKNAYENRFFESFMDTTDAWIQKRTGIVQRYMVEEEDVSSMAIEAAKQSVAHMGLSRIRAVLVASFSSDANMPNTASLIHHELGLDENCFAADINMACSGFSGALILAESLLGCGEQALVVGAEAISKFMDMKDRSTAILFGDGAGCLLVEKNEEPFYRNTGCIESPGSLELAGKNVSGKDPYIHMAGKEVFRFAITKVPESIGRLMEEAGLSEQEIDYFVLHQANRRIIEQVAKSLGLNLEKFYMNIDRVANTSAASIPLALAQMKASSLLEGGKTLLVSSFGAGLEYASLIIRWKE